MTTETTTKIPAPIYAAAGAGDLAIERLRKLPERVAVLQERIQDELPGRLNVLQDKVTQKVAELPSFVAELRQRVVDTDTDKIRDAARRNAGVLRTNAQAAQEKAVAIYAELVTRGEHVVAGTTPPERTERIVAEVIATPSATDTVVLEPVAEPGLLDDKVEATPADVAKAIAPKRTPKARKN